MDVCDQENNLRKRGSNINRAHSDVADESFHYFTIKEETSLVFSIVIYIHTHMFPSTTTLQQTEDFLIFEGTNSF